MNPMHQVAGKVQFPAGVGDQEERDRHDHRILDELTQAVEVGHCPKGQLHFTVFTPTTRRLCFDAENDRLIAEGGGNRCLQRRRRRPPDRVLVTSTVSAAATEPPRGSPRVGSPHVHPAEDVGRPRPAGLGRFWVKGDNGQAYIFVTKLARHGNTSQWQLSQVTDFSAITGWDEPLVQMATLEERYKSVCNALVFNAKVFLAS
ncbi:hypothetical protein PMIN05_009856 [Paraphaeosphaeria minitans]